MARRTHIKALDNERFTIADLPDEHPSAVAPITPELSEEELRAELIHRGVPGDALDELIEEAKRRTGTR
jgi:hypothetical protein